MLEAISKMTIQVKLLGFKEIKLDERITLQKLAKLVYNDNYKRK